MKRPHLRTLLLASLASVLAACTAMDTAPAPAAAAWPTASDVVTTQSAFTPPASPRSMRA